MVFDDRIEFISSRTRETVLKFSPREVIGGHTQEVGVGAKETEKDIAIGGVHTFDEDPVCQQLRYGRLNLLHICFKKYTNGIGRDQKF